MSQAEQLELGTAEPGRSIPLHRPLSWRTEARRQLTRRRTLGSLILLVALPLVIVAAFAIGGQPGADTPRFVDLAQRGSANFLVFVLFVTAGLLLVILASLFCGDTVPAEASWASLRYLLTGPVPRARLLTSKIIVGWTSTLIAVVILIGWSLLVGTVGYGAHPFTPIAGGSMAWGVFGPRLLLIGGYLMISLLQVCAIALWIGVRTDAPLAAVGGTVMVTIVSSILDQIDALGRLRDGLPMHFSDAWTDLLSVDYDPRDLERGMLWSVLYALVFGFGAYRHFLHKDILS